MCIRGRGVVQGLAFSVMLLMGACSPVVPEPTISPATVADTPDFAPLAATIEAEMSAQQVPGLAVGVLHNGEMIFSQGFGVADVTTNRPDTPATSFRIGSIT